MFISPPKKHVCIALNSIKLDETSLNSIKLNDIAWNTLLNSIKLHWTSLNQCIVCIPHPPVAQSLPKEQAESLAWWPWGNRHDEALTHQNQDNNTGWWYTYPSEKKWESVGMIIPNIWKNKTCSKPPTRWVTGDFIQLKKNSIYIYVHIRIWDFMGSGFITTRNIWDLWRIELCFQVGTNSTKVGIHRDVL